MGQIKNIKLHVVTDIKVFILNNNNVIKMPGGVTVKDVDPQVFVRAFAAHLKKSKLKVPEFVTIVKTSKAHELGPTDPDWFYVRAASVARHVLPSTKCWSWCCEEDLWWCQEKWNKTFSFLSEFFICCKKSVAVP